MRNLYGARVDLTSCSVSSIYAMMPEARARRESRMRRRMVIITSLVAVAAVVLAVAISPALYRGQNSASITRTSAVVTDQCRKADTNATYPLILQIFNPAGAPARGAWIILYDADRGIPFEEGYSSENGTYRTKHAYSPLQNMTLIVQNDQELQTYVVDVVIPDVVCADGYIHVEAKAS